MSRKKKGKKKSCQFCANMMELPFLFGACFPKMSFPRLTIEYKKRLAAVAKGTVSTLD